MFLIKKALFKQEGKWLAVELKTPAPYALAAAGVFMAYARFGGQGAGAALAALGLLALLLALAGLVDARRRMLPHTLNAAIALSGLVLAPLALGLPWGSVLVAAIVAWAALFGLAVLMQVLTGVPAVGGGDIWLVGALGAWLGLAGLPPFLLALALLGAAYLIVRRMLGKKFGRRFAFGPLLALAGWLGVLYQGVYWQCMAFLAG